MVGTHRAMRFGLVDRLIPDLPRRVGGCVLWRLVVRAEYEGLLLLVSILSVVHLQKSEIFEWGTVFTGGGRYGSSVSCDFLTLFT
jgi:hypothetical protein